MFHISYSQYWNQNEFFKSKISEWRDDVCLNSLYLFDGLV